MGVTSTAVTTPQYRTKERGVLAEMRKHWADYIYIAPAIIVMLVVIGYPVVYTVYLSFFKTPAGSSVWTFNGLHNYSGIFSDTTLDFWQITRNTLYWTVGSTVISFILGFGAALVINRDFLGRGLLRGLLLIPYVISYVAAAYVWRWIYHSDYGLISGFLMSHGIISHPLVLLDSTKWVMPALIVANVWKEFPFAMIMLLAGLQTVPEGLLKAARIDGASTLQSFWHVTIPHLRAVISITIILMFIANLNSFTYVYVMTGGGPANASMIWITQVYLTAFQRLDYGLAAAFSVVLFLIMLVLGYFYIRALDTEPQGREA